MDSISEIRNELKKALKHIDVNNYILNTIISHLSLQCTTPEVEAIQNAVLGLPITEYQDRKGFMAAYQPIFDLVDFPFIQCFRVMDKRKLNNGEI